MYTNARLAGMGARWANEAAATSREQLSCGLRMTHRFDDDAANEKSRGFSHVGGSPWPDGTAGLDGYGGANPAAHHPALLFPTGVADVADQPREKPQEKNGQIITIQGFTRRLPQPQRRIQSRRQLPQRQ